VSLRGSVALNAQAPLLSRRVVVMLDMSDCEQGNVWAAIRRLADALPPDVALVIGTQLNPTLQVAAGVPARDGGYRPAFSRSTGLRAIMKRRRS
jgi:hypothetical protein